MGRVALGVVAMILAVGLLARVLRTDGAALAGLPASVPSSSVRGAHARVLFGGDTHFGESYLEGTPMAAMLERHGYSYAMSRLESLTESATLAIVNLETPLTARRDSPLAPFKAYIHHGDPAPTIQQLRAARVAAVSLANNHVYDHGAEGLGDTLEVLERAGISPFGAGRSLSDAARVYRHDLTVGGRVFRLAVIGAYERNLKYGAYGFYATRSGPGTYGLSAAILVEQIQALKGGDPSLFVVAFPHWGQNYTWRSSAQRRAARALIRAGADLIVGHGAHVFQEVELYRDRWILYGLGNFVFLSPGRFRKQDIHPFGAAAALDVVERDGALHLGVALYLLNSDNQVTRYRPSLLQGPEFEAAAQLMVDTSTEHAAGGSSIQGRLHRGRDAIGDLLRIDLGLWDPRSP